MKSNEDQASLTEITDFWSTIYKMDSIILYHDITTYDEASQWDFAAIIATIRNVQSRQLIFFFFRIYN